MNPGPFQTPEGARTCCPHPDSHVDARTDSYVDLRSESHVDPRSDSHVDPCSDSHGVLKGRPRGFNYPSFAMGDSVFAISYFLIERATIP